MFFSDCPARTNSEYARELNHVTSIFLIKIFTTLTGLLTRRRLTLRTFLRYWAFLPFLRKGVRDGRPTIGRG